MSHVCRKTLHQEVEDRSQGREILPKNPFPSCNNSCHGFCQRCAKYVTYEKLMQKLASKVKEREGLEYILRMSVNQHAGNDKAIEMVEDMDRRRLRCVLGAYDLEDRARSLIDCRNIPILESRIWQLTMDEYEVSDGEGGGRAQEQVDLIDLQDDGQANEDYEAPPLYTKGSKSTDRFHDEKRGEMLPGYDP